MRNKSVLPFLPSAWVGFPKILGPFGKSLLALFALSLSSFCSVTFFTDPASFDAAAQAANLSASLINFDSTALGDYSIGGLVVNGVHFAVPSNWILTVFPANWDPPYVVGSGNVLVGGEEIDTSLPQNVEAFGAYVNSSALFYDGYPFQADALSVDGQSLAVDITLAKPLAFVGFLSTTPVATATLTGNAFLTIDNVEVYSAQPPTTTPEPMSATLALLGVGLALPSLICKVRARRS